MTRHIDHLLPGFINQQLPPDRTAYVKQHLAECARCRTSYETYENLQQDIRFSLEFAPVLSRGSVDLWAGIDERRRRAPDRHIIQHLIPRVVIGFLGFLMLAGVPCFVYNGITLPFESALQQRATVVDAQADMEIMTPKAPIDASVVIDGIRSRITADETQEVSLRGTIIIETPVAKPAAATPEPTRAAVNVINKVP